MTPLPAASLDLRPSWGEIALRGGLPILVSLALPFLLHFVVGPALGPYPTKLLVDVGIAIILAVSLNIVNGFTGQFSIGHAGFMAIGAYTAASVTYYGSMLIWETAERQAGFLPAGEWLLCGGCLVGGAVAAVFGYLVGLPSLRLRGDYLAIVTLGFGEIIRVLLQQTNSQLFSSDEIREAGRRELFPPPLGGALGFSDIPKYGTLFWVFTFAVLTIWVSYRLKVSAAGRAYLSIREDEVAARSIGIDITKYKVRAFVIAAFLAGIAGGLYAHSGVILSPKDAGFQRSFDVVIMVVLGGMGSISGTTLAAIILTLLPELLRDLQQYRLIIYALVLIVMMIVRPQGLFGVHEIWEFFGHKRLGTRRGGRT
ncbi:MAG: branched-chain amino acid ABC transporter permease [Planctomycetes bacterium]|nr:branched-chain amino acid ABC transporter permease [Planctomycetota bacterium]